MIIKFLAKINHFKRLIKGYRECKYFTTLMKSKQDSPYSNFPIKYSKFEKRDPTEFFDYYAVFSYWVAQKLKSSRVSSNLKILDLGGVKLFNAILSLDYEITSIVLKHPRDFISSVKYIVHDVSNPLPFPDNSFEVFTSPATLHLIGLGRYGDKLNPFCLINFLIQLHRVLKENADVFICLPLGKDCLIFNYHWIFSFNTIKKFFKESHWILEDYFVDNEAGVPGFLSYTDLQRNPDDLILINEHLNHKRMNLLKDQSRFSKDTNVSELNIGEYKIIYLHFKKKRNQK